MNRLQIKFIKDAIEHEHLLSEWESEFINALADRPDNYKLSEKQNHILNRISDKVNKDGR